MKGQVKEKYPGRWYAIINIAHDPKTGKRRKKWYSLPNAGGKREAQIECAAIIAKLQQGDLAEPSNATVAEFMEKWLGQVQSEVSPRTFERYAEIARKNIVPAIGQVKLKRLLPETISNAYREALTTGRRDGTGGLSPRTVNHIHRVLKKALKQACEWRAIANNPAALVRPPKVERKSMKTYDLPQTVALLDALRPTRMFIPTVLGSLCGLRRGEIAALRWSNVDLDAGRLSVVESAEQTASGVRLKETKTGRARNVSLSQTVLDELRQWKLRQAQEFLRLGCRPEASTFVVTKEDGNPIQPRSLTHEWGRLIAKANLPRIRLHDLRHSHATHMLQSNINPKIVSERLGHSKVGITLDTYSHVLPGMQEDAIAKVDAALNAARTVRPLKG